MKVKRIVSILLTGSMLLSLLPVSALAAAPVFDAPAQTTAKKAAPLVQEADASRSTEEEAATRSSRDLDAENGTADSFSIQLNAEGYPADSGDDGNWYYDPSSGGRLYLYNGGFTLKPSSESGAESALQGVELIINHDADFADGTVGCWTNNAGIISGGTFQGNVNNDKTISDGTFKGEVFNYGTISGGTFEKRMTLMNDGASITISDGLFKGEVVTEGCSSPLSISGGLFTKAVDASKIIPTGLSITGGYFVSEPTLPNGSDIAFTTVSDQNGRTFQVRVNGGFSKNGYEALYVPHGMSERQANPITVKTDTALTDCLADGVSIMGTDKVQLNDDGSYTIEVYQPTSIVLVTEKPAPSTPDEPGDELDPGFSSGAAALGIVLGTAGLGYITYAHISSLYLYYTLPGGFIPSTRQELANVLWTTAGKPDPVSTALYTDIPADAIEQQKAARWCVEQGLLSDYGATFGPDTKVTNARIIRAWNSLKKVPVPITN